jgi:hypothetical protein
MVLLSSRVKPRDDVSGRSAAADRHGSVFGDARCLQAQGRAHHITESATGTVLSADIGELK